ncbi:MAG: SGNH hydrolase domain-containing protein, partial [Hyphomicrobiaceae bacterium]
LFATIAYLRMNDIQVHVIGQVPHIDGGLPVRCALRAVNSNGDINDCGINSASALKALAPSNGFLNWLQRDQAGVTVTLPSDFLCAKERCSLTWNGVFLYRDPGHLSGVGARSLSGKLMPSNFALVVSSVSQ